MKILKLIYLTFIITIGIILIQQKTQAYSFDDWDQTDSDNEIMGTVYLKGEKLDGDILKICALAEDISEPVLGIAFHLHFESEKLAFLKYLPGAFLERGGDPFYLVTENQKKEIIFGETLRHNDEFPSGTGQIACFFFQIIQGDQYNFEFTNGVISTMDTVRQDLDKIAWLNLLYDKEMGNQILDDNSLFNQLSANTQQLSWTDNHDLLIAIMMSFFGLIIGATIVYLLFKRAQKKSVNFK